MTINILNSVLFLQSKTLSENKTPHSPIVQNVCSLHPNYFENEQQIRNLKIHISFNMHTTFAAQL